MLFILKLFIRLHNDPQRLLATQTTHQTTSATTNHKNVHDERSNTLCRGGVFLTAPPSDGVGHAPDGRLAWSFRKHKDDKRQCEIAKRRKNARRRGRLLRGVSRRDWISRWLSRETTTTAFD